MNQEASHNLRSWVKSKGVFGETLLIAGFTAAAYLATCAYEISYLFYFKIPLIFLDVQLSDVLITGLIGLIWCLLLLFCFGSLVQSEIFTSKIRLHIIVVSTILQIFLPAIILFVTPAHPLESLFALVFFVTLGFFMVKDLNQEPEEPEKREVGSVLRKISSGQKDFIDMTLDTLEKAFGTTFVMCVLLGIFLIFYGAGFGLIVAKLKSSFLVLSTQPDTAIIYSKGDSFIGVVFNQNTLKLTRDIKVITQNQLSNTTVFENKKLLPTYYYDR
jgi:hypothetical protein